MLAHASRQRLPPVLLRSLQNSYNELYLPWLCPSFYASTSGVRRTATSSRSPHSLTSCRERTRHSKSTSTATPNARRGLASAASVDSIPTNDDFLPLESSSSLFDRPEAPRSPFRLVDFRQWSPVFDPERSIIVDDGATTAPATFKAFNAISGEIAEIHQTLHACLQVGRLPRAVALMRRLITLYKPDAPGLLAAHNDYIRELSHRLSRNKDSKMLKDVQNWFEVSLRGKGVIPDASTYALMIQAALQESETKEVDRSIKRYVQLAEDAGILGETLAVASSILNDESFDILNELLPKQFAQLDAVIPDIPTPIVTAPGRPRVHESNDISEVRPVDVKGIGLEALRQSLSLFSDAGNRLDIVSGASEGRNTDMNEQRQRLLERDTFASAINRWREENAHFQKLGINVSLQKASIGSIMWSWHETLVPLIRQEVEKANEADTKSAKNTADKERCLYGPFLQYLSPEKLSAATILTCTTALSTQAPFEIGAKLANLVVKIGDTIQDESVAETMKLNQQRTPNGQKHTERLAKIKAFLKRRNPRSSYAKLLGVDQTLSQTTESLQWSKVIRTKIGTILLWHLIDVARIDVVSTHPETRELVRERQPVFFHTFRYSQGKRTGLLRFNKAMAGRLTKEPVKSLLSKHLPMVVEPKPWTDFRDGGFLEHSVPVVRLRNQDLGKRYAITASTNGDMAHLFAGLDVLGKTPWRVNRPVLEAMVEAWNTGEAFAKIPPENSEASYPPEPSRSEDFKARYKWLRQVKAIEGIKAGQRSNRCFQNFQLEIARAYVNETFYFPHNVDFRGRAYPMSPFFNHMGADNVRGLLVFAQGKELGPAGLTWLKIHLANLYGYDKASFKERHDFTMEHLADVYDSAGKPLHGKRWWLNAEDPWQCLSACIELKNALDSPDPHNFISHLPIHQDGTCNGLQHYAALGGDTLGAKQVNLEPGDRPSDIYTAVAEIVKAEVATDASTGHQYAQLLQGKVTRKVVKQTVMTNVYGVTFLGAKNQVRRQLDEVFADSPDVEIETIDAASLYVAKQIFKALSSMFNGAHDIQYWLGECASRISLSLSPEQIDSLVSEASTTESQFSRTPSVRKVLQGPTSFKTPVIWTNPVRMPVVQPYRATTPKLVSTNLQSINIRCPTPSDPVDKRKQLQGFPPNFIHSLDASHMILTALKCNEMGLAFASVHDSFWTHAVDVDKMNGIIRDSFVRMHSEDIIGRLAAEFATRYKGFMYLARVKKRSVLGKKIGHWRQRVPRQQRSSGNQLKLEELRLEKRRLDLLASNDPKDREEGSTMVTPGQLFRSAADETNLVPENDLEGIGIGAMPSARTAKLQANEQLEVGDLSNAEMQDPKPDDLGEPSFDLEDLSDTEPPTLEAADGAETSDKNTERKTPMPSYDGDLVHFWLPMSFPPVPKKGDFDVSKLLNSPYFFS